MSKPSSAVKLPVPTAKGIHEMGHGNSVEWLLDGKAIVIKTTQSDVAAVDCWVDIQLALFAVAKPNSEPVRVLFDLTKVGLTSYARKRSREVVVSHPNTNRRIAVLLTIGAMAYVMRLYVKVEAFTLLKRNREVFTDRSLAIAWLLED